MKEFLNIAQLQNAFQAALKSIFNTENKAMSTVWIKTESAKSPFEHLRRK